MPSQTELSQFKVVRLNAGISPVDDHEASLYRRHGINPQLVEAKRPEEIILAVRDCDALLVVSSALPEIVIEAMTRCRIISRLGIGTDKIAVELARQRGILVTNVPGCFSEEMADHTLAFILALARKFPQMRRAMMEGAWSRSRALSVHNRRLSNCTLGLIGFGDSARLVAQRARVFGMRLVATRRDLQAPDPEAEALGVRIVDMDTLLAEADFVSLHIPLNPQTYHLMDKGRLQQMKPGAFLINTARGAIIDEDALVEALETGRLAGSGPGYLRTHRSFHGCRWLPGSSFASYGSCHPDAACRGAVRRRDARSEQRGDREPGGGAERFLAKAGADCQRRSCTQVFPGIPAAG